MSQTSTLTCPKHNKQTIFICTLDTCTEHRLICQLCKQKQKIHFSSHANFMYRFKQIKQFENTQNTIPKLEKALSQCQHYIIEHKKFYTQQITNIKQDFTQLKKQFNSIANQYQDIYSSTFQKQINKFDYQINHARNILQQYIKQKNQEQNIFKKIFSINSSDTFNINDVIKKNSKAYQFRSDIINLRYNIVVSKNNLTEYKKTEQNKRILTILHDQLDLFTRSLFDKFRQLLGTNIKNNNQLKNSIISSSKSLSLSRVSTSNLIEYPNEIKNSQSSISSQVNLQRVELPQLNHIVANVRQKLNPLSPKNKTNLIFEGPYLFSTGVYFGQLENTKRHGWGQFVFHDGTLYEGQWNKDIISGFGRLIRNNCYYEGNIRENRANGFGKYQDINRFYQGEWKNDKRYGLGEEQFKNKQKKYIGNFIDDKYNGTGKLILPDFTYEGSFKDGIFHGQGKIKFTNGQIFQGSFIKGQKHIGKHRYLDGSYYDGMFKDNLSNGTGQFVWPDTLKYSGQWKQGMQEGVGVQIQPDGTELKGIWKNGKWEKWL